MIFIKSHRIRKKEKEMKMTNEEVETKEEAKMQTSKKPRHPARIRRRP